MSHADEKKDAANDHGQYASPTHVPHTYAVCVTRVSNPHHNPATLLLSYDREQDPEVVKERALLRVLQYSTHKGLMPYDLEAAFLLSVQPGDIKNL